MESMRHWFQNLNEDGKRWFHFRGAIHREHRYRNLLRYEAWSGPGLRLEYTHGGRGDSDNEANLSLGLLFFTLSISWPMPDRGLFKRKSIATWDGNKEFYLTDGRVYGFYVYDWTIVWSWSQRIHESISGEPWWRKFYFRIDDFFLGRTEYMTHDLLDAERIAFKLGGKEFVMDSIRWYQATWFRRRIPLCLYEKKLVRVDMKIDKPPMRSGKGENSWDCGDDGTYGLTQPWTHERPSWTNRAAVTRLAIEDYVAHVRGAAKKYGSSAGERGIKSTDAFEYLGPVPYAAAAAMEAAK